MRVDQIKVITPEPIKIGGREMNMSQIGSITLNENGEIVGYIENVYCEVPGSEDSTDGVKSSTSSP